MLSAASEAALERARVRLSARLAASPEISLADLAWTLQTGRKALPHRLAVVAASPQEARSALESSRLEGIAPAEGRPVAFLFAGQGHQHVGMGRTLYKADPIFRGAFDRCAALLLGLLGRDVREFLYPTADGVEEAARLMEDQQFGGAALFAVEWALARTWLARGVTPAAVLGHSTGEYVASCVAGVMDLEDCLRLFVARARLLATCEGAMLHVPLSEDEVAALLPRECHVALVNGPASTVVSGARDALKTLEARLDPGLEARWLRIACPAHSPLLAPLEAPLRAEAARPRYHPPEMPFLSCVTADWVSDGTVGADHWVRHALSTNRFAAASARLAELAPVALEIGPHASCGSMLRANAPEVPVVSSLPPESDDPVRLLLRGLGALWTAGATLNWEALHPHPRVRVPLPTCPFEPARHWIDAPSNGAPSMAGFTVHEEKPEPAPARRPRLSTGGSYVAPRNPGEQALAELCARILGVDRVGIDDEFPTLGADSMMLTLVDRARRELGLRLPGRAAFAGLTVRRLSAFLDGGRGDDDAILVPLQSAGTLSPLYLVYPATGVVFPYFGLARALGTARPVYGLQARGLDGGPADRTVEEMAATCVEAIVRHQPEGPYYLGAFSFGCLVVYETAVRLEARGARVAMLALIDEPAPLPGYRLSGWLLIKLLSQMSASLLAHLRDYLMARGRPWHPSLGPMLRLLLGHLRENFRYAPGATLRGEAVLLTSDNLARPADPDLGWWRAGAPCGTWGAATWPCCARRDWRIWRGS